MSNVIKQGLILQEKKDRRDSLGFCHYCGELGHIAIDHRNFALLATKRQALDALTDKSMALVLYKPLLVEEKETSLS